MITSRLGKEFKLGSSLDQWNHAAPGAAARVFNGTLAANKIAAVKIMRKNKPCYALPVFSEEVKILDILKDQEWLTPMLECGFIEFDKGHELPADDTNKNAYDLTGKVERYSVNAEELSIFHARMEEMISQLTPKCELYNQHQTDKQPVWEGPLPYIALEMQRGENLLKVFDDHLTMGKFADVPLEKALNYLIQICEILETAHNRDIVYRDHKILHYYRDRNDTISIIDWNVAMVLDNGTSPEHQRRKDLVQFGVRAMHHILTGNQHPLALTLGRTTTEDLENTPARYEPQWNREATRRLPEAFRKVVEGVLAGEYSDANQLKEKFLSLKIK